MTGNESTKSDRGSLSQGALSAGRNSDPAGGPSGTNIGVGKKVGLYGVGLLLLGLMIVIAAALLVVHYAPFASMEGVGP